MMSVRQAVALTYVEQRTYWSLSELFGGVKGMQQTCYKRAQKPDLV